jgi:hypothetical protein
MTIEEMTTAQLLAELRARGLEPLDDKPLVLMKGQRDAAVSLLLEVQQECIRLQALLHVVQRELKAANDGGVSRIWPSASRSEDKQ